LDASAPAKKIWFSVHEKLEISLIVFIMALHRQTHNKEMPATFMKITENNEMKKTHSFHIPVMGIGFTLDASLKVSQFGIDSVLSLVDDILIEKLRKMYCAKFKRPYEEISEKVEDFRAKRITSYLNLLNELAKEKFEALKNATAEMSNEIREYFALLPDSSEIKNEFKTLTSKYFNLEDIRDWLHENLSMGSIDVNIMTKLDKENFKKDELLPAQFNDAHAALRGYANSDLESSIVLSAGLNPRLYGYFEQFADFFPDASGYIKKKIVLKVSDYRSAFIQGKFLAKKGLWISEYRVESGLNCGGHAFATDGYLMGPILAEFRDKRIELAQSLQEILTQALTSKNRTVPSGPLPIKITAQGGVGTAEEHQFLIDHYNLDSIGWATPFLLVDEVTNVDAPTRALLRDAREEDIYLSNVSPLGVPFYSLRGNTKDLTKQQFIVKGRPGSPCPKKYLVSNKEYTNKSICTASRQYQHLKLKELDAMELPAQAHQKAFDKIVDKSCICVGLGTSALLVNNLETRVEGAGVSVCPGPNLAYFSKMMSLKDMVDHIYGRANMITHSDRPNLFIKELNIYIDYLKEKIEDAKTSFTSKQEKYFLKFSDNLNEGISYYTSLFDNLKGVFEDTKKGALSDLQASRKTLHYLSIKIKNYAEPETAPIRSRVSSDY